MTQLARKPTHLETLRAKGLVRPRDLEEMGIPRDYLQRLVELGSANRLERGLYEIANSEFTEYHDTAAVVKRIPKAIVCLISALSFHGIGTQIPRRVWIAIDRKARKPKLKHLPVRIVRFSGAALHYGVQEVTIQGVQVRITSPARTVVDCFRYRNKIGLDVAIEALRDARFSRLATVDEIWRAAEVCRAATVIRPYLESLA